MKDGEVPYHTYYVPADFAHNKASACNVVFGKIPNAYETGQAGFYPASTGAENPIIKTSQT